MCTIKIRDSREDITTQLYNINKSYKHHNTSQGPRGLEYKCSIIDESAEATISEYRQVKQVCLKKASTNWDTDRKRRRPPAWDPPKLLLVVVSGLHVVVGTSSVVGVVVDGGV